MPVFAFGSINFKINIPSCTISHSFLKVIRMFFPVYIVISSVLMFKYSKSKFSGLVKKNFVPKRYLFEKSVLFRKHLSQHLIEASSIIIVFHSLDDWHCILSFPLICLTNEHYTTFFLLP